MCVSTKNIQHANAISEAIRRVNELDIETFKDIAESGQHALFLCKSINDLRDSNIPLNQEIRSLIKKFAKKFLAPSRLRVSQADSNSDVRTLFNFIMQKDAQHSLIDKIHKSVEYETRNDSPQHRDNFDRKYGLVKC